MANGVAMLSGYLNDPADLPTGLRELYLKHKDVALQSYSVSITYMDIMAEIIRRTMKRVDADKMTGEDCWKTMMTDFEGYKPYGPIKAPITVVGGFAEADRKKMIKKIRKS